jgi:hypothetical protein
MRWLMGWRMGWLIGCLVGFVLALAALFSWPPMRGPA